jgi:glycosyltransferase involved in cell wall biosynthesis
VRVGIYSELSELAALGGREFYVAAFAEALRERAAVVEFIHHSPQLTREGFTTHFGVAADAIQLRLLAPHTKATIRNFAGWLLERRKWEKRLSTGYDVFICVTHDVPVRCYSRRGLLVILFPFFQPYNIRGMSRLTGAGWARLRGAVRTIYMRQQWRRAVATYCLRTSISEYARSWTRRRWRIDSTVIYPPNDGSFQPGEKRNLILSVGRFSSHRLITLSKRQLEMMRAFVELNQPWEYASVGALGNRADDHEFFAQVQALASQAHTPAQVLANAPRETVRELYGSARIFWHAAGYADDDQQYPELMEHYGISTVDAMSAGAVPVVINKGAQPELVEHGVSGFLWNTLDELKGYTLDLMRDESLRARMAAAAQERARKFSRAEFVRAFFKFAGSALNSR